MSDIHEIYQTIIDGLTDNARNNDVPIAEGWTPDLAIETYAEREAEALSSDDYARLQRAVMRFLAAHRSVLRAEG